MYHSSVCWCRTNLLWVFLQVLVEIGVSIFIITGIWNKQISNQQKFPQHVLFLIYFVNSILSWLFQNLKSDFIGNNDGLYNFSLLHIPTSNSIQWIDWVRFWCIPLMMKTGRGKGRQWSMRWRCLWVVFNKSILLRWFESWELLNVLWCMAGRRFVVAALGRWVAQKNTIPILFFPC